MMSRLARKSYLSSFLLAIAVLTTACHRGNKKDPEEGMPVQALYTKAHGEMEANNWSKAATSFRHLVAQYPYGPYTAQAIIEEAYANYKDAKYDEALVIIDRFIRTYPTNPAIPYMYYLRGLVNSNRGTVFLRRVWSLDPSRRDLSLPYQAFNDFSVVVSRFPNSRYAADARARMQQLQTIFSQHELDVALYYLRRHAWISAVQRASDLLQTYPNSVFQYDAIAVLGEAYTHLGNKALADQARQRLQEKDPNHPWLTGHWPKYPWAISKLNPFASEKSAATGQGDARIESKKSTSK